MKILILTIFIFFTVSCSSTGVSPELPPTIEELRQPILKYLADEPVTVETRFLLNGINVQNPKPNVFLVFADVNSNGKTYNRKFIAQKYTDGGKSYWQVIPATPYNLQTLGIISPIEEK